MRTTERLHRPTSIGQGGAGRSSQFLHVFSMQYSVYLNYKVVNIEILVQRLQDPYDLWHSHAMVKFNPWALPQYGKCYVYIILYI